MSWASLVLAGLKAAVGLITWMREKQLMQAGQDKEIARTALAILEQTNYGRELRNRVNAMTDPEAEALWKKMIEEHD